MGAGSESGRQRPLARHRHGGLGCRAAEKLRAAGTPCPEVSVGSTPTALSATNLDGVTEVRAGVYAVFDLVMVNVGFAPRRMLRCRR
jgi:D-serine deaminase-like pyridoxal phosphate-dependent protein